MFDFQRLRRTADIRSAPLLAASIFLDVLDVFSLFLTLFSRGEQHGQGHDQWLARVRPMPVGETVSPCASHIAGATEQTMNRWALSHAASLRAPRGRSRSADDGLSRNRSALPLMEAHVECTSLSAMESNRLLG